MPPALSKTDYFGSRMPFSCSLLAASPPTGFALVNSSRDEYLIMQAASSLTGPDRATIRLRKEPLTMTNEIAMNAIPATELP